MMYLVLKAGWGSREDSKTRAEARELPHVSEKMHSMGRAPFQESGRIDHLQKDGALHHGKSSFIHFKHLLSFDSELASPPRRNVALARFLVQRVE